MPTIIEGEYGIEYRQSPYLYNNYGFKAIIAEGNILGGITAKSNYIMFFDPESRKMRLNIQTFVCTKCGFEFTWDLINNRKLPAMKRYQISRRQFINKAPYCRHCADEIKDRITHNKKYQIKQIADSLNIPLINCDKAGTCEILKAHHNILSHDPDRLTTEFMIGMICGEEGIRKYKQTKINQKQKSQNHDN